MQFYFFTSPDVFEQFTDNFELNLDKINNKNPHLMAR